jgi:antigen family protein
MSDPSNPYGSQPAYGTQASYGNQPAYGNQASYGNQLAYGTQASYGAGASYGQPMYGHVVYALNPAVERVRSNVSMVRIMSFISFVTLGPLLSFGAWFWSMSLVSEAESLGAPEDVLRDVRGARTTALICGIVETVIGVLIVAAPILLVWLTEY